jgi:hypothetical protein
MAAAPDFLFAIETFRQFLSDHHLPGRRAPRGLVSIPHGVFDRARFFRLQPRAFSEIHRGDQIKKLADAGYFEGKFLD